MKKKLSILHISTNNIFIKSAFTTFERVFPNNNEVWIFTLDKEIKKPKIKYNKKFGLIDSLTPTFLNELKKFDIIILHSLELYWYPFVFLSSKNIKFAWIGWGYDYQNFIYKNTDSLLHTKTNSLKKKCNDHNYISIKHVNKLILKLILIIYNIFISRTVFKKIKSFSPVLKEEYDLIEKTKIIPHLPKFMPWNYGNLEDDYVKNLFNDKISGTSILVGNNASYTNNHIEIFEILGQIQEISSRKVFVPLSYGYDCYRTEILKKGNEMFGQNFNPIINFMPFDDYINTIKKCGFVIMYHLRQQSVGVLITMLYLGARVFLMKTNPTYIAFKKIGIIINSTDDMVQDINLLSKPLEEFEIQINKSKLRTLWSKDVNDKKTKELIEYIIE